MGDTPTSGRSAGHQEFRRLHGLCDMRQYEEALGRARLLLEQPQTGQFIRAQTHDFLCWLLVEPLRRPGPEAVLHGEEAVRLLRMHKDWTHLPRSLIHLAQADLVSCNVAASIAALKEAGELLEATPDAISGGRVLVQSMLGEALARSGRSAEAMAAWEEGEQLCLGGEHRLLLHDVWRRKALFLLREGDIDQAKLLIGQLDECTNHRRRSVWWKTSVRILRARLLVAQGHLRIARQELKGTLALAQELGDLPTLAEAYCLTGVMDHQEQRQEVERSARSALYYAVIAGRPDLVEEVHQRLHMAL